MMTARQRVLLTSVVCFGTACTHFTIYPEGPPPAHEEEVRVLVWTGEQTILGTPSVEGEDYVGAIGEGAEASVRRIPLDSIAQYEVRRPSAARTFGAVVGGVAAAALGWALLYATSGG